MADTKISEMTPEELLNHMMELKEELFNLRINKTVSHLENPSRIKILRRDIARCHTFLRQADLAGATAEGEV